MSGLVLGSLFILGLVGILASVFWTITRLSKSVVRTKKRPTYRIVKRLNPSIGPCLDYSFFAEFLTPSGAYKDFSNLGYAPGGYETQEEAQGAIDRRIYRASLKSEVVYTSDV